MNNKSIYNYLPKTATAPLLTINILFFIIQLFSNTFTELLILSTSDILTRPWIILTSMFLHGGAAHLFFNMYVLLIFGPLLESRIGSKRFLIAYFLSGIMAAIGYSVMSPDAYALGASGAMMGILGVTIMLLPNLGVLFFFIIPMSLRTAGIIIAIIDLIGLFNSGSGVAHWAHLYGLATGLIYGWYLLKQKKKFQSSFGILRKIEDAPIKEQKKNLFSKKKNTNNSKIKDADYTEKIQLDDEEIDEYIRNGRL
jgi:uncharacterized protein